MDQSDLTRQLKQLEHGRRAKRIAQLSAYNAALKKEWSLPSIMFTSLKKRINDMARRLLNETGNTPTWRAKVFTVTTAGTPVQLNDLTVPDGYSVALRALIANGAGLIYLANTSANTASAANRFILRPGDAIKLHISNLNLVWIDGSVDRKSTRLNSSHIQKSRMPSSA